ncbi:polyprenyl synthetase family protein [Salinispira pacifica]
MPSIITYLSEQKDSISRFLGRFAADRQGDFAAVNGWGPDLLDRLCEFSARGKMIRGALVVLAESLYAPDTGGARQQASEDAVRVAAALELVQSFLLIHDDIMDQDFLRRGKPSLFVQYTSVIEQEEPHIEPGAARRFGEAMGICAGDVAMLLAFDLLAGVQKPPELRLEILRHAAREIGLVGVAQMGDVYHGVARRPATEEEILGVYRYKTGRYTFSLPLLLGAILGGARGPDREKLVNLGEHLGLLFQIKDDDLGIWGSEVETGKPVGSDLAEGKQTLHRYLLLRSVDDSEGPRVEALFRGGSGAVDTVRRMLRETGVQDRIVERMKRHAEDALSVIDSLEAVHSEGRRMLNELVAYNLERSS